MRILVVVKQVPDSTTVIRIRPDGRDIQRSGVKLVVNPFDEFAIEQAVRLREARADVERISALIVGPAQASEALRTVLAVGADDALHLEDQAFESLDDLQTAALIAAVLADADYDLILTGKQEIDLDNGQLGPALAEFLDIPHVGVVTRLEFAADGRSFVAHRRIEGADEVVHCRLPALITCEKGLGDMRYPSLPNLIKAKRKPVRKLTAADVPNLAELTARAGGATMQALAPPPARPPGKILDGEPQEAVRDLVRLLREEAQAL